MPARKRTFASWITIAEMNVMRHEGSFAVVRELIKH